MFAVPNRWLFAFFALVGIAAVGRAATVRKVDFSHDVLPILSDNCFACHGPDTSKIKGGLRLDLNAAALKPAKSGKMAIVPGKPGESELIRRLLTTDLDDRMPPPESHKTLTAAQRDLLQRWVAEGAEYKGHWAYTQPVKPVLAAKGNPVDILARERLKKLGLRRAPEADRRTLARRVYSDLTGLPPSPVEVEAFEKDSSPGAYENMVDRLLASPHYGERMSIGWLDAVRFADTIGYHSDNPRNIWPYRDYVIRAFNDNKPFDQFTREQLAGDLLPNPTQEQKVASAFNRLLLTTEEGGAQPKDYEARYLTDRVRAVGSVWLGQTIGCAQCHDHKFDPITQRDFYSMGAFFADIKETIIGARESGMLVLTDEQSRELARREQAGLDLQREFDGPHPELAAAFAGWVGVQEAAIAAERMWTSIAPAVAASVGGATLKVKDDASILASGKNPDSDSYIIRFTNAVNAAIGLRLEVLPDDSLPAKGPGRAGNGNFVLTEIIARIEQDKAVVRKVPFRSAQATHEQSLVVENNPYHLWSAASAIDGDVKGGTAGWAILPEVGKIHQLRLALKDPLTLASGETLVVELQQAHGNNGHNLGRFRLAMATDPLALSNPLSHRPSEEIASILKVNEKERSADQIGKLFALFKNGAPELEPLRKRLAAAKQSKAEYEASLPRCLVTEKSSEPRTVRILPRGNFLIETGDIVEPLLPGFLVRNGGKTDGRRLNRLDLANWLVSNENPLTARVVMNRMWKQFFGVGLSKVLDDFGAQGEPPPNQALLDWLAADFVEHGWDLRRMVRTMVVSETYRQASSVPAPLLAADPDNRALARQGRWRLDAELVRDNALAVAGLLQLQIGGPSVKPYQPEGYWENLNFPQRTYEADRGQNQHRRGLYTWWQRSFVHPSMLAFDAPTREECTAERNRSNIPQQALVLLNDPIYVEAARALASRILRECGGDVSARIHWAWRQTLARSPRKEEVAVVKALLEKHLAEFRADRASAEAYQKVGGGAVVEGLDPAELAAWTDVARTLLNLHETITRS